MTQIRQKCVATHDALHWQSTVDVASSCRQKRVSVTSVGAGNFASTMTLRVGSSERAIRETFVWHTDGPVAVHLPASWTPEARRWGNETIRNVLI